MGHSHAFENKSTTVESAAKLPGHWLLAHAGKRVLRPGGVELTDELLRQLNITARDTVIELAPGLGHTAGKVLARRPSSYLGVDREGAVVRQLDRRFGRDGVRFVQGSAEDTGLPGETATVMFGEAMLTMQPDRRRRQIVEEAWRVVRSGGRYGMHELCISGCVSQAYRQKMEADLAAAIRHSIRLLTVEEWRELMESAGFHLVSKRTAPMRLLNAGRILQDEGVFGALRFALNTLTSAVLLRRVLEMRRTFHQYQDNLQAVAMICHKEY